GTTPLHRRYTRGHRLCRASSKCALNLHRGLGPGLVPLSIPFSFSFRLAAICQIWQGP
ncbi:hypothetical protein BGX38DRAFT_468059, partial [Terfezia claveryi]